ncbi:GntR family transcriptional regulator [Virgibacillus byunsanensis]|uniref:GntR family transcriptional regulator n=1 Tax=Virgibacillus byunsanensis TaxID=570945 RepID=A0ABW3LKJ7_9BACI
MKLEAMTLSQKIAQSIADQIVEGYIKPGERLLENKLTDTFGTSRAPIREALYILESDGIVERVQRRGVFVKEYNRKELIDLYDVVYRLEEFALKKAIVNATDEEIARIFNLLEHMADFIKDREIKDYFPLMEELHQLIFLLSKNDVLDDLYRKIYKQLRPFRYMALSYPDSLEQSFLEYYEIAEGLKARDIDQTLKALQKKEKRVLLNFENLLIDSQTLK